VKECYDAIKTSQGEQVINTQIHVWNLQLKGHANYVPQVPENDTQDNQDSTMPQPFMQELVGNDFVPNSQ
jgi:hypothetical protein